MKNKQEHIDAIAPHTCFVCEMNTGFCECIQHGNELCGMAYEAADRIYKAGYRKASDVIDEFVERLKKMMEYKDFEFDDGSKVYNLSVSDFWEEINELSAEMRQEVEK